ncbi:MAG: translation initiation factor IF-3 [Candidatus Komeilibacteria bacterium]|nr:translation initiation factor IF-3 [Candidatus Komeilibacteria bacterium]
MKSQRVNHQIRVSKVFLIDHEGNVHKDMPTSEALRLANEVGLDLVEMNPTAQPPVCKIMDYGQFQYQQKRKQQQTQQKSKRIEVKGLRLSFKIGKGDLAIRKKQTEKFIDKGHRVRIEMFLRGRERQHGELGKRLMEDFIASIEKETKVEQPVTRKGNSISAIISPK